MTDGKNTDNISAIVAADRDFLIGFNSEHDFRLPWNARTELWDDMAFFSKTTYKSCIIMGRKTLEGIGLFLPSRFHLVFSHQEQLNVGGKTIRHYSHYDSINSCDEPGVLLSDWEDLETFVASQFAKHKLFLLGGAELFSDAIEHEKINNLYLTVVDAQFKDTIQPEEQPIYLPKNFCDRVVDNWGTAKSLQKINKNEKNKYSAEIFSFPNLT